MFKRVMWPNKRIPIDDDDDDFPMLPKTLWPYIQYVYANFKHRIIDPSDLKY